jgi:restriction system protein
MKRFPNVSNISPEGFELQVKAWLESVGTPLESFSATHLEKIPGMDGEYEIDVVVRFKALAGANFLVLVECKKHVNDIKREVVQSLREKQLSLGAQKAMLVSTAGFQSGAREYAQKHGIALVQLVNGAAAYLQASASRSFPPIPETAEDYAGLFYPPRSDLAMQPFTARKNYGFADFFSEQ